MRDVSESILPAGGVPSTKRNDASCNGVPLREARTFSRRELLAASVGVLTLPLAGRFAAAAERPGAPPADWTSYRNGPQLLGLAGSPLRERLEVRWTLDAPDGVAATAAISGGRVYVADLSGELRCVDRATGQVLWTYRSVEEVKPNTFAPGFKSSPTLTADTIYLGDEDGVFHAIDRQGGTRKWTFETEGEIISSATVEGDHVLFGSYDNTLYCLNRKTGERHWAVTTDGYVHCTPAVSDGKTFIAGCDEHLRVIDIATGTEVVDMPIGTYLIASPATREGLLYFGTYAATVIAVDPMKKEIVWTYRAERDFPFHSSAAVTEKLVIAGGRDRVVHAMDRATGERVWTFATRSRVDSSPVVAGERVYVGSSDRNLYCLDLATGREIWTHNIGQPVTASPAIGEGVLVIGGEGNDAKIVCLG
jgi:outer membrane protein assembly factor BamB